MEVKFGDRVEYFIFSDSFGENYNGPFAIFTKLTLNVRRNGEPTMYSKLEFFPCDESDL